MVRIDHHKLAYNLMIIVWDMEIHLCTWVDEVQEQEEEVVVVDRDYGEVFR